MEVFKFPNNYLQRKQKINIYLVQNAIVNLTSFQFPYAIIKLFDALFLPYILLSRKSKFL